MRRLVGFTIAAAALLMASTADAGLRAVYIDIGKAKQLQIDVFDNGDARIAEVGSEDYGLMIGGQFYIVDIEDGKPTVARLKDVATAIDKVLPPIFKGLFDQPGAAAPTTRLVIEPGETGSAGGRDGRVYRVKGLDSSNPDKPTDYLISDDPELKPVGAALEQFMNAAVVPAAPLIGAMAPEMIAETRAIFALGTPIDVGGRFRLNLAGKAAFPAAYFRLPAQPQTVDQLVAAMKLSMAKK
ncbi:hypothetical protein [Rhizorhabdus argentea]|uniref:hypothetical protein n=1 Tax=Rhizorhabdus argentea TaxID=1387174 RepID=UPI0030EC3721